MNKLYSVYSAHLIDLLTVQHAFLLYSHYSGQVWWSFFSTEPCVVKILRTLDVCWFWTKPCLTKATAVFGFCAACVAGVLKALTFFRFIFLVCMLAFMLVCEFIYILITDPIFILFLSFFLDSKPEQWLCRVPRTFQLGTWIFTTWRTKWRMWMYSFTRHFTHFWCVLI